VSLTVTTDLNSAWDNDWDEDLFLKEVYFTFENICSSNFGLIVGKTEVPFGYMRDDLLLDAYWDVDPFTNDRAKYIDRVFQINPYYNFCDKFKWEFSVFQDREGRFLADKGGKEVTVDGNPFMSMATRFTWTPIENFTLSTSGYMRHLNWRDDRTVAENATRSYAASVAADYTFRLCGRDINVFAEYIRGWNPNLILGDGFEKGSRSDNIHAGYSVELTKRLKAINQGEWIKLRNDAGKEINWRTVSALQYTMKSGVVLEGGWQYNRQKIGDEKFNTNTFYTGLRYRF